MGDLRIFNLNDIRLKYGSNIFVETGTLYGAGVDYAKEFFTEIHSIEIDKELADKAKEKYKDDRGVYIHNGNSADVLETLKLDGDTLFWLDAHFPGADAHKVSYDDEKDPIKRAPLEKELTIISKRLHNYQDVIIIDDMWLYEDGPFEWGSLKDHLGKTRQELIGKDSTFIYDLFAPHRLIKKDYRHQGYFIITPKYENI
jgi:hypothetical protein